MYIVAFERRAARGNRGYFRICFALWEQQFVLASQSAANNMARQPEVCTFNSLYSGCAFIEALTLIGFVVTLMVSRL